MTVGEAFRKAIMEEMDELTWPEKWLNLEATDEQNTAAWFRRIVEWAAGVSDRVNDTSEYSRLFQISAMAQMAMFQIFHEGTNPDEELLPLQMSDAVVRYENESAQSKR